ncbi:MAG: hypothetical protein IJ809_06575 [Clostridia bacterium]|nr:hypothetical protein [Clostridia bacterium]
MKRVILFVILFIALLAILFGTVDIFRVKSLNLPIFCINVESKDDAGSGKYIGLGYSFDIKGNFLPDGGKGVTQYDYKILGIKIISGIE